MVPYKSGNPVTTGAVATKEVLREFLYTCDGIFPVELQKVCFYGDLYCVERWGRRLTDVTFRAYMYGAYSKEIKDALEDLKEESDIWTTPAMRQGKSEKKYYAEHESEILEDARKKVVRTTSEKTCTMSVGELTEFSKDNWLYKNTPTGEVMDFLKYHEKLIDEGSEVEPELETPADGEMLDDLLPLQ